MGRCFFSLSLSLADPLVDRCGTNRSKTWQRGVNLSFSSERASAVPMQQLAGWKFFAAFSAGNVQSLILRTVSYIYNTLHGTSGSV